MRPRRVLILGGTAEAAALAARLAADPDHEPVTSLAGRTLQPAPLAGAVRRGGFGGAAAMATYLATEGFDRVVDATHPYAATISRHAAQAAARAGLPLLRLERPPWQPVEGDRWIEAGDVEAAAAALETLDGRVFLSIGRQTLQPFARLTGYWFLVRMIEPPDAPPPLTRHRLVLGRGPFDAGAEARLLAEHRIGVVVSKNSGGDATYGKIAATRRLGLPVVMIARPPRPAGHAVGTVDAAMTWIAEQGGKPKNG